MADNNYVDGGGDLGKNYLPANPYADLGMLINKFPQIGNCKYYASVGYVVSATGALTTITPLTGNLGGDLRYYRVEVYDGTKTVTGQLDLLNRSTDFTVDTSTLNANVQWTFAFYGSEGGLVGDVGCDVPYKWTVAQPKAASGNTVPPVAKWDNVKYTIKLESSTDSNYSLFPDEGIVLSRGSVINLQDYSTIGSLTESEDYTFDLYASKVGLNPSIALPVADPIDLIDITGVVTFPFPLSNQEVKIASLVADTASAGTYTGTMASVLTNEGVTPSIEVTINTLVV